MLHLGNFLTYICKTTLQEIVKTNILAYLVLTSEAKNIMDVNKLKCLSVTRTFSLIQYLVLKAGAYLSEALFSSGVQG